MKNDKITQQLLFDLFLNCRSQWELYESTKSLFDVRHTELIKDVLIEVYDDITDVENSVNNANWEERHSEQIDSLNKIKSNILKIID